MAFVNLNIKSGYSFLRSTLHLEDIIEYGKHKGCQYLGLTDENAMFIVPHFYNACKENNIQPVIGMEVRLNEDNGFDYPLILLAKNSKGYQDLCYLTSLVSKGDLKTTLNYSDINFDTTNVVSILPLSRSYYRHLNPKEREQYLSKFKNLFKDFYIGMELYSEDDEVLIDEVRLLTGYKRTVINEVRGLTKKDWEYLHVLKAIELGTTIDKLEKYEYPCYFRRERDLSYFTEDELSSTEKIAKACQFDIHELQGKLITYPLKAGVDPKDYLKALCQKGLSKRLKGKVVERYQKRLDYELSVINSMGFTNYFLVVYDYVKFAKQNGILVGPGRGSGAGSLTAYVLGITNVDPITNNLLFERFLNPERVTMPDIDIDFIDTRRDEVIAYLVNKYGLERTAHVIAFQTFAVKQSLRDAAKAIGLPNYEVDNIAKKVPQNAFYDTLSSVIERSPSFKAMINGNETYRRVYDIALHLEGLPRQTTLHAAGMVINDAKLHQVSPVYSPVDGVLTTQFDMNHLEEFGLLKMDILGLKNLGTIEECLENIRVNKNINVDINKINFLDPRIYQLIANGNTSGIFQLESNGMKRAIRRIKPTCFEDIVALLALFRPGPMDSLQLFADRKHGKVKVSYPDPCLEEILKPTYGTIVYQEQITQILVKMAGFSLGQADIVRRAISKKKEDRLSSIEKDFIDGCLKNGHDYKKSKEIYDLILKFAGYGFNRAHSVSYAMISVIMAYLKCYYPQEFYIALLNNYTSQTKFNEYVNEMKRNGVELLPPSINYSSDHFVEKDNKIIFSLGNLKGITPGATKDLMALKKKGMFADFLDFLIRAKEIDFDKKFIEVLIYAGAFDEFGSNRTTLFRNLDTFMEYVDISSSTINGQITFDPTVTEKPRLISYPKEVLEEADKEQLILGLYLTSFPLKEDREKLKAANFVTIDEAYQAEGSVKLVVYIASSRSTKTKKGDFMAHVRVKDESGEMTLIVFPKEYQKYEPLLKSGNYIQVLGELEKSEEQPSLLVKQLKIYHLQGGNRR